MAIPKIEEDGSVSGDLFHFSGQNYKGGYPYPRHGEESFAQYRGRVQTDFEAKGFNVGDLIHQHWKYYCKGSGRFEGVNADQIIF